MTATHPDTRIAVIGAGGVGGLLAAMLARAGNHVTLLTRGAALAAIGEHGIRVHGLDGDYIARPARVSDDAAALGPADIVLVTVKTWQLAEIGPQLAPLCTDRTLVVPMQNGVEASETLARSLSDERVIGAVCRMFSWVERPGEIRWAGIEPSLTIGARLPGQRAAIEPCAAALRTGGIEVLVTDDIARARWLKFLFIAPYSAVGATERVPLGALRKNPRAMARLDAVIHEVVAVGTARGVRLPPDAFAITRHRLETLPDETTTSMQRDLVDGRPSELHELIGAVVRLGREAGIATPVAAELHAELEPHEQRARAG
jgi:2-dehydropantoate 2-reductase